MARVTAVPYPHGETVTRQRGTEVNDGYSSEATSLDWDVPDEETFTGCAVWQETSTEVLEPGRAAVTTVTKVALPADADVSALDRFVARGVTYEIRGVPEVWRSPLTGWEPGLVVTGVVKDG